MFAASPRVRAPGASRVRTRFCARSRAGHSRFAPRKRGQARVGSFCTLPQILSRGFVEALLPNYSLKRTAAGGLR